MNKFAFIIHPLEIKDIYRKYPFLAKLPANLLERAFRFFPPTKVSHIEGIQSPWGEVEGFFIACPLTTRQLLTLPAEVSLRKISESVKLAEELGAQIVGLGAMTSVVGDAGVTIAKNSKIPVTTGNCYTVASALEATIKAAALMDIDLSRANIAILGATGSIGSVIARLIARQSKYLLLLARNSVELTKLARTIMYENGIAVETSNDPKGILPKADIVISVTSSLEGVIDPMYLKPGAIVCDVARPRDVSLAVKNQRKDILVIEGGVIKVPGSVNFNFDFGFPPGLAYACMAETMILALEQKWESFSLGRELTMEKIEKIRELAQKHNFQLAGMRSFEEALTEEQILNIKKEAIRSKKAG